MSLSELRIHEILEDKTGLNLMTPASGQPMQDQSRCCQEYCIGKKFYSLQSPSNMIQSMLIAQGYVASYNTSNHRYFFFKKYSLGIQNIEYFKFVRHW